jgi:hypothetical protein
MVLQLKLGPEQPLVRGHRRVWYDYDRLLSYGLDEQQGCLWWKLVDWPEACMPGTYTVAPDYWELVRRLPPGTGEPRPDNTLQISAGTPLAEVFEAAKARDAPHILFLDAIPDLTAGAWAEDEAADKAWKDWIPRCEWAKQEPPSEV